MTQTLTTEQLRARAKFWREKAVEAKWESVSIAQDMLLNADAFEELAANREAQPVAVTDEMALAFHRALNDGGIGESDLEEIKVGLRGALCNITAPPAPANARAPWHGKCATGITDITSGESGSASQQSSTQR
ncbi:hypothetical protein [Serratia marcescens]|uniref:hypothetical protein n=1 Tax=Serratia marcescens TaxID=615 RepID=UPI003A877136